MKLYFRGEEKGNLSYTTDGVRFTSTTLDALRDGITLPDDTDYTKVQVKAGSNVFSALDVVKKVELVQGGADLEYDVDALRRCINPCLELSAKVPSAENISDFVYCVGTKTSKFDINYYGNGDNLSYGGGPNLCVLFQNKNTKRLEWQLDGAVDDASDYEYVLIYTERTEGYWSYIIDPDSNDNKVFVLANLGPIEPFFGTGKN